MYYLQNALVFVISTVLTIYISIVLIRFLLQLCRCDSRNQLAQTFYALTRPLVRSKSPWVALLVAFILQILEMIIVMLIRGFIPPLSVNGIAGLLVGSAGEILYLLCTIYIVVIIFIIILSWIALLSNNYVYQRHPIYMMLQQLLAPLLKPMRKIIPVSHAIDFATLALILSLFVVQMIVANPLMLYGNMLIARG